MIKMYLALALLTCEITFAQLVHDNFELYTVGQQLSGQGSWTNNSSNPGGLGVAAGGGTNSNVVATSLSYLNYGTASNALEIKPNSDGCGTSFVPVTSGDLYVSFVLNLTAAQVNNNSDFFRVFSGGNYNTTLRLYATSNGFSFNLGVAKGANGNQIASSQLSYNYNQDHLIVIKYSQLSGISDDVISVYIDPVFANGASQIAAMTTNSGLDQSGSIDRMSFRQNWTNGMPTGKAGLISVGKTWEALSFATLNLSSFENSNVFSIVANDSKNGWIQIQANSDFAEDFEIKIHTVLGTLLQRKNQKLGKGNNEVHIHPISNSGVYIIEIIGANGMHYSQKIIVP